MHVNIFNLEYVGVPPLIFILPISLFFIFSIFAITLSVDEKILSKNFLYSVTKK